jgi:hypothetical protein
MMGVSILLLFIKFAQRDSDGWDISYEKKRMKITRIVLMSVFGGYATIHLFTLLSSWLDIHDYQKVVRGGYVLMGVSVFLYGLKLRQSPRGIWVKLRKVIAYILIGFLYVSVWPTTLLQLTTGMMPGVYGNAMGTILIGNTLIYGVSLIVIWLLLRNYKCDKLVPYNQQEESREIVKEKGEDDVIENSIKPDDTTKQESFVKEKELEETSTDIKEQKNENVVLDKITATINPIFLFLKRKWKWILGVILLAAFIYGGITLYNYIHDEYIPKRKLDKAVSEIVEKFNAKETKTEYALKIISKDYDWGYKDIIPQKYMCLYYNGNDYIQANLTGLYEDAFNWIEKRAYEGNANCQSILGDIYHFGDKYFNLNFFSNGKWGVESNDEKAAYWWLEAAQNGYTSAFRKIGLCYRDGIGVPKDMVKAVDWMKKGAEVGDSQAQKIYGDFFEKGVQIIIGWHTEISVTKDSYYGSNNDIISQYIDGNYNFVTKYKHEVPDYKTIIPADIEQAKYWWKKAAAQGNIAAKERLQKIYE